MGDRVIGIDLGTMNSCAAVAEGGKARILQEGGRTTVPSCLAFVRGKEVVGEAARRHAGAEPRSAVSAVKRLLGHSFESPEVQAALERTPYPIRPSPLGNVLLEVGGHELTPVQISARILHRVREVAESALGSRVSRAVISVPAHFTDLQRKATKLAAEYAGIEAIRLVNEPTAAAFAYGYRAGRDLTLAVYDLGGGTFDVTIMTARGDTFEVEATSGDSYLGGEDFDEAIVTWLEGEFAREHGHDLSGDDAARLRLKDAAERAKIELSETETAEIELPFLTELPDGSRPHFTCTLTRARLEELCESLVARTLDLCRSCLEEAGLRKDDLDEVLLVGGQTRTPLVRRAVREFFGREPRRDINPDEVVAMGAALFGYSLEAPDLAEQAEEAAEEAYGAAVKGREVARTVLDEVDRLQTAPLDDQALASRLEALLSQAEGDLPGIPTPPRLDDNLPEAVSKVESELETLERRTNEVIRQFHSELPGHGDVPRERAAALEEAAERLEGLVSSAHEASRRAQTLLDEAEEHAEARKVNLIDVTSHALGITAAADLFSVVIPKNSAVPVEATHTFTTDRDGQTEVEIRVGQGASARASENQPLGAFVLEGLAPAPRMSVHIEVSFQIDADGILAVSARDPATGRSREIRIEDPLGLQQQKGEGEPRYAELDDMVDDTTTEFGTITRDLSEDPAEARDRSTEPGAADAPGGAQPDR
ncbi:MAG: Hsp70 family protein [Myxococcota bacterium]